MEQVLIYYWIDGTWTEAIHYSESEYSWKKPPQLETYVSGFLSDAEINQIVRDLIVD